MIISELIELLKEQLEKDGDSEVVLEVEESEYRGVYTVYDVTGKWSIFDRSRYDGSPVRCFIHGK